MPAPGSAGGVGDLAAAVLVVGLQCGGGRRVRRQLLGQPHRDGLLPQPQLLGRRAGRGVGGHQTVAGHRRQVVERLPMGVPHAQVVADLVHGTGGVGSCTRGRREEALVQRDEPEVAAGEATAAVVAEDPTAECACGVALDVGTVAAAEQPHHRVRTFRGHLVAPARGGRSRFVDEPLALGRADLPQLHPTHRLVGQDEVATQCRLRADLDVAGGEEHVAIARSGEVLVGGGDQRTDGVADLRDRPGRRRTGIDGVHGADPQLQHGLWLRSGGEVGGPLIARAHLRRFGGRVQLDGGGHERVRLGDGQGRPRHGDASADVARPLRRGRDGLRRGRRPCLGDAHFGQPFDGSVVRMTIAPGARRPHR